MKHPIFARQGGSWPFLLPVMGLALLMIALAGIPLRTADAAPIQADFTNQDCVACHGQPNMTMQIGGQPLSVSIDLPRYGVSVHAEEGVGCTSCHADIKSFPHAAVTAGSPRDFSIQMYTTCKQCHAEQYEKVLDSVHQKALAGGNTNAAVCTDCHNPHAQTRITDQQTGKIRADARLHIPDTCARCHSTIYDDYKQSVHGKALTEEGNIDVPTCIDCHGVHNIQSPTTASFRNSTPFLCAKCHTDPAVMDKYGISTHVLDTYVADFHGTTVTLFDKTYPDQPTNKPVCTDCHGIHDIVKVDDPQAGIALRENLLGRCQRCHPDATANFPDAWMSHYVPSPEKYPVVYYVNLFYKFFIPTVLGGMILFVLTDVYRRFIHRGKGKH